MKTKKTMHFILIFILTSVITGNLLAQAVIDQKLRNALAGSTDPVEVVVTFKGDGPLNAIHSTILANAGITRGFLFRTLPIAGVLATSANVQALANNPQVRSLYLNEQLTYDNYNSRQLTGVDKVRKDQTITAKNGGFPISGKGIGVVINDSGIEGTHKDLEYGRNVVQNTLGATNLHALSTLLPITYIENMPTTELGSGHGMHVAGIVGGTGINSAGKYQGAAPGANLIGYGSGAALLVLDGLGGFDYALTHQFQYGIRVITNSWGNTADVGTPVNPNDPVTIATKLCYDRNIVVVFSAGNAGPAGLITGNYKKAPWVVCVAAGDKYGRLADFSSRGVKNQTGSFEIDGDVWNWEDRPTVTAPGTDIISTRALVATLTPLGAAQDISIEPAYIPYYTTMSGTSMAAPHVAGIVALLLEANPSLSPLEVKQILQRTATNIPGRESWEAGAGYVNAFAAVDNAFRNASYGSTLNYSRQFNSNPLSEVINTSFTIAYNPVVSSSTQNKFQFTVGEGITALTAKIMAWGLEGQTGNTVGVVLISPLGEEYSSGVNVLFPLYYDRSVVVASPMPGEWTVEVRGLRGDAANPVGIALPEDINGNIEQLKVGGIGGLNDIAGHPAEASIKLAVSKRLADGYPDGNFYPDNLLTRIEFADYLTMGQAIRQYLPTNGTSNFSDVSLDKQLLVESITAKGAAIRDRSQVLKGVMLPTSAGIFSPEESVKRIDVAYSFIQSLGLQLKADSLAGTQVKVYYNDQQIILSDNNDIPTNLRGYVQLALDLNLINAYFALTQGPYDLTPTMHASFKPNEVVSRGDFAVIVTRTFNEWTKALAKSGNSQNTVTTLPMEFKLEQNYPNPFNPTTSINFSVANDGIVNLEIFNMLGEKVATLLNEYKPAGKYSVNFDASKLASGIYLYRINTNQFVKTMKMSLIK
ncbi:MAG: peptidase S8/S53 subtilisin kexin sedolisin [Stygiobacter sp.]|nr:MAG: peptidase S8/S53 subtilisin kexin sedolisin [Stygiobacter sp.]KAF0213452.1 MAG: peptidase S8/S53 subtilisin kexin [Ignavibacteria bacterium]